MSNIVQVSNLPAHLAGLLKQEPGDDFGKLKPSDFGIGFVKICGPTSRERRASETGEPAIPEGAYFCSRDRSIIPIGTPFVPLCRQVTYIKWEGKPGEGRMAFSTSDPNDKRIRDCNGLTFIKNPRTNDVEPPLVTEYVNYYCLVGDYTEPLMLSFKRTSYPIGRKLTRDLFQYTKGNCLPLFSVFFKFEMPILKTEGSNAWFQLGYAYQGYVPATVLDRAKEMHELAITMRQASTGAEFREVEDDDTGEQASELKNITPPATPQAAGASSVPPAALTQPQAMPNAGELKSQSTPAPANQAPATPTVKKSLW
jgi:hypothetical protein